MGTFQFSRSNSDPGWDCWDCWLRATAHDRGGACSVTITVTLQGLQTGEESVLLLQKQPLVVLCNLAVILHLHVRLVVLLNRRHDETEAALEAISAKVVEMLQDRY